MLSSMKHPMYVRPVTDAERAQLVAGLRSSDAFVHRRSQILLASARGEQAPQIARHLGCAAQTVRNAIVAFNARGPRRAARGLLAAPSVPRRLRCAPRGATPSPVAPEPPPLRETDQCVALGVGSRGELRAGSDRR